MPLVINDLMGRHTDTQTNTTHTQMHKHTQTHIHTHTYIHTHIHTHICAHTYTHIHTHTCTHINTYIPMSEAKQFQETRHMSGLTVLKTYIVSCQQKNYLK